MDAKEFFDLARQGGALSKHIQCCAGEAVHRRQGRIWEKSIPLWVGAFFAKYGVAASRFNGNLAVKRTRLEKDFDSISGAREASGLLKAAGKSANTVHADFAIMADPATGAFLDAIGMLEIKSLLGYEKSKFPIKKLADDICVAMAYSALLRGHGRAFALFLNQSRQGKSLDTERAMAELGDEFARRDRLYSDLDMGNSWRDHLVWIDGEDAGE